MEAKQNPLTAMLAGCDRLTVRSCADWPSRFGEEPPTTLDGWRALAVRCGVDPNELLNGSLTLHELAVFAEGYFSRLNDAKPTEAPSVSDQPPAYAMLRDGRKPDGTPVRWRIRFGGQETLVDHRRGADHLRRLLAEPGNPVATPELHRTVEFAAVEADTAAVNSGDNAARVEELKDEWAAVRARLECDDLSGMEERELRDEQAALENEMARLKGFSGQPRAVAAHHKDDAAVRKAIKDFRTAAHAAGAAAFADHVEAHVRVGSGVATYDPPAPLDWQF